MPGQKVAATLSSGNRRKTAPISRDIIGFDAKSTVEARHTLLPGNQKRELDKLLGGSVCLFRPTDMNHRCQEGVESVSRAQGKGIRGARILLLSLLAHLASRLGYT